MAMSFPRMARTSSSGASSRATEIKRQSRYLAGILIPKMGSACPSPCPNAAGMYGDTATSAPTVITASVRLRCSFIVSPCLIACSLAGSPLPVLRKHVIPGFCGHVAREPACGVVPLRRCARHSAGREGIGRSVVVEDRISPSAAIGEALAVLDHEVHIHELTRDCRGREKL